MTYRDGPSKQCRLCASELEKIDEELIPVREEAKGACEILGLDPLYVVNEGKLIAIVSAEIAERLVDRMKRNRYG